MKHLVLAFTVILAFAVIPASLNAEAPVRHDLKVVLYPQARRFTAEDRITVPEELGFDLQFRLHRGLQPSSPTAGVRIAKNGERSAAVPVESFRASLPPGQNTFVLEYGGILHHPVRPYGKEQARGFKQTPGVISGEGVYLAGGSFWYPGFGEKPVTFSLLVELPNRWDAVSQGERIMHHRTSDTTRVRWESPEVQEEIYLVAGPFTEYMQPAGRVTAMVFLRTPDEALAGKYLDATVRYLAMYSELIGPYPYKKFALVENFWETGFGMPSFTLLGPRIIRFPFILHSSYPHEILHNWWGNSVFPDYRKGNWAEGLTAYLSDHLIKEMRGKGTAYRQETLQKYADYVLEGRDFPLAQFRSRHSTSSEAVGYGKSLMLFHMLRRELGDKTFVKGLQDFYRKHRFRTAAFEDLRRSFEDVSEEVMHVDFNRWVTQPGAPALKVSALGTISKGDGWVLSVRLEQTQPEGAYRLRVPVAVTMEHRKRAYQTLVMMDKKRLDLKLRTPARPVRIDVDPEFDLFRRLDRDEIPAALTQTFGARKMLIVLPSSAEKGLLEAYRDLARSLGQSGPDDVDVRLDTQVKKLPGDRVVILLGWENRFIPEVVSAVSDYDVRISRKDVSIGHTTIPRKNHAVVITARPAQNKNLSLTWIASDLPEALPGLGRKLPHYHKYSYLGFQGREPANVAKGRWPVYDSPMTVFLPRGDGAIAKIARGKLAAREPLGFLPPVFSKKRMMETVHFLSGDELRGRGLDSVGLERAAEFIAAKFKQAGLEPAGDSPGSYFQTWTDNSGDLKRSVKMRNVVGVIPGKDPKFDGQSVVLGAHYDHLGMGRPDAGKKHMGKIHPGADDNASGVAVLIELARVLGKNMKPERSLVFAAFTGEELGRKGSRYYVANQKRYPARQCMGMLNLDTVGRLEEKKLLVLGAGSAKEWVHIFRGAGYVSGVPVEVVSAELDSSDQKSFQEAGVPAVQLFSGPHLDYHRPTDTADKVDPDGLLKVASVAKEVTEYLAGRKEPMTTSLTPGRKVDTTSKTERKVSLGTIPDFAYQDDGYRLAGVVPGSPAEACGLMEGDVIVRIDSHAVRSIKDLAATLKSLSPGDRISVTFRRQGKEMTVETETVER